MSGNSRVLAERADAQRKELMRLVRVAVNSLAASTSTETNATTLVAFLRDFENQERQLADTFAALLAEVE